MYFRILLEFLPVTTDNVGVRAPQELIVLVPFLVLGTVVVDQMQTDQLLHVQPYSLEPWLWP